MIRKYLSIILSIAVLVGVIVVTMYWIGAFYQTAKNYRSPVEDAIFTPAAPALPKTSKVVVVLISGLGQVDAERLNLPNLVQLAQTGASATVQSYPPTYSQISEMTLATGAPPDTNGAPPLDLPVSQLRLNQIDTIFARAHEAQLKTALLGAAEWRSLIPRNHVDETFFANTPGPDADEAIVEAALLLLQERKTDLLFIHLTQLEFAAKHLGGTESGAYQQAAAQIDAYLGQLSRAVNFGESALIIVSDHGHTESGGYGGSEIEITRQPLVMVGDSIAPGSFSDVQHTDIAPTITTLLGIAPPAATQGRALFEMLRLTELDQTVAQLALARQRIDLAKAFTAAIAGESASVPDSLDTDLAQAQTAFEQKNTSGAFQLAQLAQESANTQLATTRHNQINAEQLPRLLVSVIVFLVWAIILWRRRGRYAGLVIITAIIAVALYHILYQIQGFEYSISSLSNFESWPASVARRTAVSLLAGGGILLILLMLTNEQDWVILLGTGYGFGVLVTFLFSAPLFWAFWQNGFEISRHLPDVDVVFWQITACFEAMISAILALVLPWPIMALNVFVNHIRRSLDNSQSRPESDALPGLRL